MAQSRDSSTGLDPQKAAEVKRRVQESIDLSTQAILSHKPEAIPEEFSVAFSSAGGDFTFENRDALIHALRSGAFKYESIRTHVERVDISSESVAVVTGKRSVKAVIRGDEFASTFPFKAVHAVEDGKWKVALWAVNC